jgi:UPF0755 protein
MVVAMLVPAIALAASGWWSWNMLRPSSGPEREFVVAEGASAIATLDSLEAKGILRSALAARLYLETAGRGRTIRWGAYRFPPGSRGVDVIERLLAGAVATVEITLIEGLTADEIRVELERHGVPGTERWPEIVASTVWIRDLAPGASSLEGFLFPETYRFARGVEAREIARTMVEHFVAMWGQETARIPARWSVVDTVTLASLVEGETGLDSERARVAGVYVNRLDRGMLLQCDPTVVYVLKRQGRWSGRLLRADLDVDDPYNTYRYPGLPPGPIGNPGRAAIRAALDPEAHRFLYFVLSPRGGHTFSRSLAEHNRAVAVLRRSRR